MADTPPSPSAWVLRTADICASVAACCEAPGEIELMSRGSIDWVITIPADGSVPVDGVAPALIEWHTPVPPATRLVDVGLSLTGLEIFHPAPARVSRLLASLGLEWPVTVEALTATQAPDLVAHIRTPRGLRELSFQMPPGCPV